MEHIYDFAKSVIYFTVFENIWEIMLPKGSFAPYIKLLFGFMLVGMIIAPFANIGKKNIGGILDYNMHTAERDTAMYDERYYAYIKKEFSESITSKLRANGFESVKSCKADIEADEKGMFTVKSIEITVKGSTEGIKEKISEYLGFDVSNIEIRGAYEDT